MEASLWHRTTASRQAEVTREHLLLMGTWKRLNEHQNLGTGKATTKRPDVFTVLPCSHASSGLKLAKTHQLMFEQAQEVSGVAQITATRFPLPSVCPGGETRARRVGAVPAGPWTGSTTQMIEGQARLHGGTGLQGSAAPERKLEE